MYRNREHKIKKNHERGKKQMKETYESPDFEVIELEGEVATANTIKDSNETDILSMDWE